MFVLPPPVSPMSVTTFHPRSTKRGHNTPRFCSGRIILRVAKINFAVYTLLTTCPGAASCRPSSSPTDATTK